MSSHYIEAIKWYLKADNDEAKERLIHIYEKGKGVEKNLDKAAELCYEIYLKHKYSYGQKAASYCLKAAEYGYKQAWYAIAECYWFGKGIEKNGTNAFRWYKKAAEYGEADAQAKIGDFYYYGDAIEKNDKLAFEWWHKAAEQNHACSQYNLGISYITGNGTTKNLNQAFIWLERASDNGNADAKYLLATWYEEGEILKKDIDKAIQLYQEAADGGNWKSKKILKQYKLKENSNISDSNTTNFQKEIYRYLQLANNGNAEAQYKMGVYFENGDVLEIPGWADKKGNENALKWYIQAAEQGLIEAQYKVAEFYREGKGTLKDLTESDRWTQRAKARKLINEMKSAKIRCHEKQKGLEQTEQNLEQNSQDIPLPKMERLHQQESEWGADYKWWRLGLTQDDFVYIKLFEMADSLAMQMHKYEHFQIQETDLQTTQIYLTMSGIEKCEDYFGLKDLSLEIEIHQYLIACLYARYFLQKDVDYECKDDKIFVLLTGKTTIYEDIKNEIYFPYCIHHALELKEGLEIDNYEVLGWLIYEISHMDTFENPIRHRINIINSFPFGEKNLKILKKYTLNPDETALAYYSNGALATHEKNNILITNQRILYRHSLLMPKKIIYLNDIQRIEYTAINEQSGFLSFILINEPIINKIFFMGDENSAELFRKIVFLIRDCVSIWIIDFD